MSDLKTAKGDVRRNYLPPLDGLRGLAIAAVAFHHFGVHPPAWMDWGPIGPSIFFLLSGYLITFSLKKMRANAAPGTGIFGGRLLGFHARRIGRLLPIVLILLASGAAVGLPGYRENWPWHATFLSNFLIVTHNEWAGSLSHLWSLSMQEQFYLLWPLVLCGPRRFLVPVLGGVILGALAFRLACGWVGASDFTRWFLLPGSLDTFATGGLVAWLVQTGRGRALVTGRWNWPVGTVALLALALSRYLRFFPSTHPASAAIEILECAFFGWILLRLVTLPDGWMARALSWRPLCFVGMVSYGIFIFHVVVGLAVTHVLTELGVPIAASPVLCAVACFAASVAVAAASWHWLEQPINHWVRAADFDPIGWLIGARDAALAFAARLHSSRSSLMVAVAAVWLAVSWTHPSVEPERSVTDEWSIFKTTYGEDFPDDILDLADPANIDNSPDFDVADQPQI